MSLECPTHGTDWQAQCYRCALARPSTGLSREVHHAELSDNPGPSQGQGGDNRRSRNIVIEQLDVDVYKIKCTDCQTNITSWHALLHHQCPPNTVQSSPGQ